MRIGKPVKATLIKLVTDDGITDMNDDVRVGDEYIVYPASKRTLLWGRAENPTLAIARESVFCECSATGAAGWFALELLRLEE